MNKNIININENVDFGDFRKIFCFFRNKRNRHLSNFCHLGYESENRVLNPKGKEAGVAKKITYREYKRKTGKKIPPTDKHGFYKNKSDRFFLGKFTDRGKQIHPAAVVGECQRHVLYVIVTHSHGGRYGSYKNPDPNGKGKVGLQHNVQSNSDENIHYHPKYANYRHEPLDSGLDRLIEKSKKGKKK